MNLLAGELPWSCLARGLEAKHPRAATVRVDANSHVPALPLAVPAAGVSICYSYQQVQVRGSLLPLGVALQLLKTPSCITRQFGMAPGVPLSCP